MKCCVLEDCNRDLNQIISCIQADDYLNNQLSIKSYTSTSQIDLTTDIFDILLLDIDLPDKNGIDFANDYIKIYPNAKIIFISSHNELVFDSFKVHPYSFIKKENINLKYNDNLFYDIFLAISGNKIPKSNSKKYFSKYEKYFLEYHEDYIIKLFDNPLVLEFIMNIN